MIKKSFEAHGLPCLVVLNEGLGNYCGYAGVPNDHPWYGKTYMQLEQFDNYPDVHGGITFAGHIKGQDDCIWWIGFDCAHAGDWLPHMTGEWLAIEPHHKWTVEEVAEETRRLAEQLAEVDA